ncbi:MFS transporter [Leifsonia shinshuensis]|uniref:MFS family permease n=1 Tax=Leifsonia shinshuensis TaxID=150026 RepID=A0A853CZ10_9MICO|nr:MFS transporter [Leifsonia shinshuensis]NYJ25808.1 MFS family permease [Leifsonia shinshuensis]
MTASPDLAASTAPTAAAARPGPRRGFLFFLGAAVATVNGALLASAVLTLSLKAVAIDPTNATTVLSIVVGVGSIVALVGYPLIGRLSDRTISRFGRRRPFLVGGAVLLAVGAVLAVAASSTAVLTLAYVVTTVGAVCSLVACSAIVPDQVEPSRRGTPSAIVGLGAPIGALLGIFLAQTVQPNLAAMILVPAAVAVVFTLALAFFVADRPLAREDRPAFAFRAFLATFWVNPAKSPAFAWAWWSRLLIFFGVAAVNAYQAFYLIIVQHVNPATVGTSLFVASLVGTGVSLVFAPLMGKLSDRVGRRKPFVIVAALIFGVGLALVAFAPSFPMFLVAIAVIGAGQGVYFAVDFALVTQVLPDPANPAKDLGIMNLASALPSSLVPALAPALLSLGASAALPQNFGALFLAGAIAALLGAAAIIPIRGVK